MDKKVFEPIRLKNLASADCHFCLQTFSMQYFFGGVLCIGSGQS